MTAAQKVIAGLQIILSYEAEAALVVDKDIIYFGSFAPSKMSNKHVEDLKNYKFFFNDKLKSWFSYV